MLNTYLQVAVKSLNFFFDNPCRVINIVKKIKAEVDTT